jgi:hypothetical protein
MSLVLTVTLTVIAVASFAMLLALTLTVPSSPLRIRHRIMEAPEPEHVPEPRVPRDTSRPYPRGDSAATEEQLRACPVCGMTDLDQMIPDDLAEISGWPAHASCKEWLGGWKPPAPEVKELQQALDSFKDHRVPVLPPAPQAAECFACGQSRDCPHTHKAGDPAPTKRCACGAVFVGTPEYLAMAMEMHRKNGCRAQFLAPEDQAALGHLIALQEMFLDSEVRACKKHEERLKGFEIA